MEPSSPVQYLPRKKLIEKLNFLHNKRKKCGFCKKIFCEFCEVVKALETEMCQKAFFLVQLDVTKWRLTFQGKTKRLNLKAIFLFFL